MGCNESVIDIPEITYDIIEKRGTERERMPAWCTLQGFIFKYVPPRTVKLKETGTVLERGKIYAFFKARKDTKNFEDQYGKTVYLFKHLGKDKCVGFFDTEEYKVMFMGQK